MQSVLPSAAAFSTLNHRMQMLLSDPQIQQAELSQLAKRNQELQRENMELTARLRDQTTQIQRQQQRIAAQDAANAVYESQLKKHADALFSVDGVFDQLQCAYAAIKAQNQQCEMIEEQRDDWRRIAEQNANETQNALTQLGRAVQSADCLIKVNEEMSRIVAEAYQTVRAVFDSDSLLFSRLSFPKDFGGQIDAFDLTATIRGAKTQIQRVSAALHKISQEALETHLQLRAQCLKVHARTRLTTSQTMRMLSAPQLESAEIERRLHQLASRIDIVQQKLIDAVLDRQQREAQIVDETAAREQRIEQLSSALHGYKQLLNLSSQKVGAYLQLTTTLQSAGLTSAFK